MGRMYDLIILEPMSGDVGVKTAEHVCELLRKDLRWAIAGKDIGEMGNCLGELKKGKEGRPLPAIEICSGTKDEVQALVKKTKVLINLSELSDGAGERVVEACATNGTHYLDTANDIHWLGGIVRKYHDLAKANRAIILSHISVESTPQDLLSLCAVLELRNKLDLQTREVVCAINERSLSLLSHSRPVSLGSNSTSTSSSGAPPKSPRHPPLNPWYLSLIRGRTCTAGTNRLGLRRELTLGLLSPSQTLASQQARVLIHRGWALQHDGKFYGENFYYNEYYAVASASEGLRSRMGLGWMRRLCHHGEGANPGVKSEKQRIFLRAIALADQEGPFPDRALSEFSYVGSSADLAAAFLAQAAATILHAKGLVTRVGGGGVLTPAVLGMDYVNRLLKVGVEIRGELV